MKKIIALILVFFLIDLVLSFSLAELSNKSKIRYSMLYNGNINADIIFIGNSRGVNTFYSPYFDELTNLKTLNLSYNGLSIPVVKILLDDYLSLNNKPQIILLEISCLTYNYGTLVNFKQYMGNSSSIKYSIKEHYPDIYYASLLSKTFRYNSEYFLRTLYYLRKDDQKWINRYQIKKDYYDNIETNQPNEMFDVIDSEAIKMFAALVKEYNNRGILVIPVLAPILDKSRNENSINNYISSIETIAKTEVLNLSKEIKDISMFADTIHTNQKGAEVIANKIYTYLQIKNLTNQ